MKGEGQAGVRVGGERCAGRESQKASPRPHVEELRTAQLTSWGFSAIAFCFSFLRFTLALLLPSIAINTTALRREGPLRLLSLPLNSARVLSPTNDRLFAQLEEPINTLLEDASRQRTVIPRQEHEDEHSFKAFMALATFRKPCIPVDPVSLRKCAGTSSERTAMLAPATKLGIDPSSAYSLPVL